MKVVVRRRKKKAYCILDDKCLCFKNFIGNFHKYWKFVCLQILKPGTEQHHSPSSHHRIISAYAQILENNEEDI